MTNLIEQIKLDREAGTPGPYVIGEDKCVDEAWSIVTTTGGAIIANVNDCKSRQANARRIARVPELEAALLAAEKLVKALEVQRKSDGLSISPRTALAIAAFRKATGGDNA